MVKVKWGRNPFEGRAEGTVEEMENEQLASSYIAAGMCVRADDKPVAKSRKSKSAAAGKED